MYSINEVQSTFRKAILGAGFDTGIAEDLSRASVWLCQHGFEGAELLLEVLANTSLETKGKTNATLEDNCYIFKNINILLQGPSILDVLVAEVTKESTKSKIYLRNVDSPLLFLALLAITVIESELTIELCFSDMPKIILSPTNFDLTDVPLKAWSNVLLTCSRVEIFKQQAKTMIVAESSIVISKRTWQTLESFAAKTYVAATEASRLAGAGAGLTDND